MSEKRKYFFRNMGPTPLNLRTDIAQNFCETVAALRREEALSPGPQNRPLSQGERERMHPAPLSARGGGLAQEAANWAPQKCPFSRQFLLPPRSPQL